MPPIATKAPMAIPAMAPELRLLLGDGLLAPEAVALDRADARVTVVALKVTVTGPVPTPNEVEGVGAVSVPNEAETAIDC